MSMQGQSGLGTCLLETMLTMRLSHPFSDRAEKRGLSMHYFDVFAVRDRVNYSHLSDEAPLYSIPDSNTLLPSAEDISSLKKELSTLVTP